VGQQSITPELRRWIVEQAQAGCRLQDVFERMIGSGWDEQVAMEALETSLQQHMDVLTASAGLPTAVKVPEMDLSESPAVLDLGDRQVIVVMTLSLPRVVVLDGLLSDEECDELIALADPCMARSLTVQTQTGGDEVNAARTSDGMFFRRGETRLIQTIEERIARLVNWPVQNGEGLQVLHYKPGAQYQPHYDYFDPVEPGTPTILKRGGQRVATLVMYLNHVEKGGATTFPDAMLEVAPRKGSAVFFSYDRAHPSSKTLHGGAPVIAGEKWVATKWLRESTFE
jgi:prolyl 4-hydroxylase